MKKYPAYKPSGVDWIGDVPEHWEVKKLKYVVQKIGSGITPKGGSEVYQTEGIPLLRSQNIHFQGLKLDDVAFIAEEVHDSMSNSKVLRGDVLLNITGASIGRCYFYEGQLGEVNVNQHVCIVRPNSKTQTKNLYYFLSSELGQLQIELTQTGSGREGLNFENLKNFILPLPPLPEQTAIAHYLDRKTAQLDQTIADKQRLIALLREERQAIINHAVTKGIRSGVPMKDSGVAWIGEVPEGWVALPIRFVARLESGHTPSRNEPTYWENCTIPWFTLADVHQIRNPRTIFVEDTTHKISELGLANSAARLLPANTVLLSRTASVGYSGIAKVPMATSQDFVNWICGDRILPLYLLFVFRAMTGEFNRLMIGSTHKTIYMPDVMAFKTPLPSVSEQAEIVAHLDQKTAEIDAAIAGTEQEIGLLREYRAALVFEAVTGKVDVRGADEK